MPIGDTSLGEDLAEAGAAVIAEHRVRPLLNHGTVAGAGGDQRLLDRALLALRQAPPPATSKVSLPGGLVSSPGRAPYSLVASDEGSNAMGTEERRLTTDCRSAGRASGGRALAPDAGP